MKLKKVIEMNFRERALKEFENHIKRRIENEERYWNEQKEKVIQAFADRFDYLPKHFFTERYDSGVKVFVQVDDLKFEVKARKDRFVEKFYFYPIKRCARCGQDFASQWCAHNLIDCGRILAREELCPECEKRQQTAPDLLYELAIILKQILALAEGE